MLRTVSADVFSTEKFKEGLVRAFVKVGLAELENGVYVNYTSHARVAMPSVLAPADSPSTEQFTISDVAVEYETDLRDSVDDEADGQLDADDADDVGVGGS